MRRISRRDVLRGSAGLALGAVIASPASIGATPAWAAGSQWAPEKGAKLRLLRWKRFVAGDETLWMQNTKKFTETTGIPVRVDNESWEDVRPKAAVAANIGSGPDIILGWYDDPHQYPDKLVDLSDLAGYLGDKYGGWYPVAESYGTSQGRWIGLPLGAAGACIVYRRSHVQAAGFEGVPGDTAGFLKLCQALHAKGTPAAFALGNAVGDGNVWAHWILWSHGGKVVDKHGNVAIHSDQTRAALEYAAELYQTFIPGTTSWLDGNNNKAFLAGKLSLTANGISIYYAAKTKNHPLTPDIDHANLPVGPVGHPAELHLLSQAMVMGYTKYPNAAKAYLQFMWERAQYEPWQQAAVGYITQPLRAYESNPVWTADPKHTPYRDIMARMQDNGHAGPLGYASAAIMADYVVVNMVAEAASGAKSPKEAMARAQKRAERYYKV